MIKIKQANVERFIKSNMKFIIIEIKGNSKLYEIRINKKYILSF